MSECGNVFKHREERKKNEGMTDKIKIKNGRKKKEKEKEREKIRNNIFCF